MNNLRVEYLQRCDGDHTAAAVQFAFDLMQDDPATLKAGYTLENAALAAHEVFPKLSRVAIQDRLSKKLGGRQAP